MRINEDGAAGSWAADWLKGWGVLLRLDYSQKTGNPEHDLTKYEAGRAQRWGYYGCGGEGDKSALDEIARMYPVREVAMVTSVEQCEAAIDAGCPVTVASGVGFEGDRNSEGIIRRSGNWPHQMVVLGKKYTPNGDCLFRLFNSWGKSAFGPDPGIAEPAISDCSWWIVEDDLNAILREQDSFAMSSVAGFENEPYNFDSDLFV
jgi:hypothetical protein